MVERRWLRSVRSDHAGLVPRLEPRAGSGDHLGWHRCAPLLERPQPGNRAARNASRGALTPRRGPLARPRNFFARGACSPYHGTAVGLEGMSNESNDSTAGSVTKQSPCRCGSAGCQGEAQRYAGSSRGRTGLVAAGAAAVACLACLVPGAAVALGAAGVVAFTPAGVGGALVVAALVLVAWRLIGRRRSTT